MLAPGNRFRGAFATIAGRSTDLWLGIACGRERYPFAPTDQPDSFGSRFATDTSDCFVILRLRSDSPCCERILSFGVGSMTVAANSRSGMDR